MRPKGQLFMQRVREGCPAITSPNSRCRVCQLAWKHADVCLVIHEMMRSGSTDALIARRASEVLIARSLDSITDRSIHRHRTHVTLPEDEAVLDAVDAPPLERGQAGAVDDHAEAWKLYDRLLERVRQFDQDGRLALPPVPQWSTDADPKEVEAALAQFGHAAKTMRLWLALLSEMRHTLESINRMRNSDRLVHAALAQHTRTYSLQLADALLPALRRIAHSIRSGDPNTALAALSNLAEHGGIAEVFQSAAGDAYAKSCADFRLRIMH